MDDQRTDRERSGITKMAAAACLFIAILLSIATVVRPAPVNFAMAGLFWIFWAALFYRGSAVRPSRSPSYQLGCLIAVIGGFAFGGATLFAFAHSMDPIGPKADWFPLVCFGGLTAMIIGLICVLFAPR